MTFWDTFKSGAANIFSVSPFNPAQAINLTSRTIGALSTQFNYNPPSTFTEAVAPINTFSSGTVYGLSPEGTTRFPSVDLENKTVTFYPTNETPATENLVELIQNTPTIIKEKVSGIGAGIGIGAVGAITLIVILYMVLRR